MDFIDTCVIGAGVVGLAIARSLAPQRSELIVLDEMAEIGQGVSSRNSEVIHAGIYYAKDSLKARFCVHGKHQLYEYCQQNHVAHQNCGKLIVANGEAEERVLAEIQVKAEVNGVDDLVYWSAEKLKREEPAVRATAALFSPSTGIVSAHELMDTLLGEVEQHGGVFAGNSRLLNIRQVTEGFELTVDVGNTAPYQFRCRQLVNSAGLGAQAVAASIESYPRERIPPLHLCKGDYFTLAGANPFNHLIYPVPDPSGAGLGVHATIDLGGQVKFGPDVEYIDSPSYGVDPAKAALFYESVSRYYPDLNQAALMPGYAGIRPKLQGPGDPVKDFMIETESDHGVPDLVQLFGIESPGLTSSLAIGQYVLQQLDS